MVDLEGESKEIKAEVAELKQTAERDSEEMTGSFEGLGKHVTALDSEVQRLHDIVSRIADLEKVSVTAVSEQLAVVKKDIGRLDAENEGIREAMRDKDNLVAEELQQAKNQFGKWKRGTDASLSKATHDASERIREQNIKHDTLSLNLSKLQVSTQMDFSKSSKKFCR